MSSEAAVLWLVAGVVSTALGGYLWRLGANAMARRARRLHYQRDAMERAAQRRSTPPGSLSGGIRPERATAIRLDAENAARLVAAGLAREPQPPHAQGTPEFVLWVASYHLTLTELTEDRQAQEAPAWPAPRQGISQP